eukprot:scaffold10769_cov43-Prasinocladus_malaysianus.AAC.1
MVGEISETMLFVYFMLGKILGLCRFQARCPHFYQPRGGTMAYIVTMIVFGISGPLLRRLTVYGLQGADAEQDETAEDTAMPDPT